MSEFSFTPLNSAPELSQMIQTRNIPNALLFVGNKGTGKKRSAFELTAALNCLKGSDRPCLACSSCKKIMANAHPDIIHVKTLKNKKEITIAQIRELFTTIAVKPHEAAWRMILISKADKMNTQSQNALLKILEEPPVRTFFVLTTNDFSQLLTTIVSRCRQIHFKPLTRSVMIQQLMKNFQVSRQQAWIAAGTAGSDMKKAEMLLSLLVANSSETDETSKELDWSKRREWILKKVIDLVLSRGSIYEPLLISEKLSREPAIIDDWFMILQSLFRDLSVFKFEPEKIVNLDFFGWLKHIHRVMAYNRISQFMDLFCETEMRLKSNTSLRLTLDRFFIKLSLMC